MLEEVHSGEDSALEMLVHPFDWLMVLSDNQRQSDICEVACSGSENPRGTSR